MVTIVVCPGKEIADINLELTPTLLGIQERDPGWGYTRQLPHQCAVPRLALAFSVSWPRSGAHKWSVKCQNHRIVPALLVLNSVQPCARFRNSLFYF